MLLNVNDTIPGWSHFMLFSNDESPTNIVKLENYNYQLCFVGSRFQARFYCIYTNKEIKQHNCRYINGTCFMILLIKQTYFNTPNFNFTEFVVCAVSWITSRIRRLGPVVVIDDVSAVRYAGYIDMIRYRISCVAGVFETEKTVFLGRCIRYVHRESKESTSEVVDFIYKCTRRYTFNCTTRMAIAFVSAFIELCHFAKQNKVISYRTYEKKDSGMSRKLTSKINEKKMFLLR